MKKCKHCGIEIIRNNKYSYKQFSKREYCSNKCKCLARHKGSLIVCKNCKTEFYVPKCRIKVQSFCSHECYWIDKINSATNENNPNWKGDAVGYHGMHKWIERKLGKPSACELCGTTENRKYQWSNISREYKRELSDWRRLCIPCHKKYDLNKIYEKNKA